MRWPLTKVPLRESRSRTHKPAPYRSSTACSRDSVGSAGSGRSLAASAPSVSRPASRATSSWPAGVQTSRYAPITTPHGTAADHPDRHKPLPNGKQSLTGANHARRGDRAVPRLQPHATGAPAAEVDHLQPAQLASACDRGCGRTLAMATAMAALVATLGAGHALAGPDERVLERQGMIDRQAAAGSTGPLTPTGSLHPPGEPSGRHGHSRPWRCGRARCMLVPDLSWAWGSRCQLHLHLHP